MSHSLKILIITAVLPSSPENPGCPRIIGLSRCLGRNNEIILYAYKESRKEEEYEPLVKNYGGAFSSVYTSSPPGRPAWFEKNAHRLRQMPSQYYRVKNPEYHRSVIERIGEISRRHSIDTIYYHGIASTQFDFPGNHHRVADLVDSMSLLYDRYAKKAHGFPKKLLFGLEARSYARWEASLSGRFDEITAISKVDAEVIRKRATPTPVTVVPNGVDTGYFAPTGRARTGNIMVFSGVMSYSPNAEAAVYFAKSVFPRVRAQWPDAEFWIVGSDAGPQLKALNGREGVRVTGRVPDIRPYLDQASLFVCPILTGAGMKNKILSAMSMGLPIVATPLSMEGIDIQDHSSVRVAEGPQDLARAVIETLASRERSAELGRLAREVIRREFSWEKSAAIMENLLAGPSRSAQA